MQNEVKLELHNNKQHDLHKDMQQDLQQAHLFVTDGIYHSLGSCNFGQASCKDGSLCWRQVTCSCRSSSSSWAAALVVNSVCTGKDQLSCTERLRGFSERLLRQVG